MVSTEQSVKEHFSRVFGKKDWKLFKEFAELNLREASLLRRKDFPSMPNKKRLLARNVRKRLLIGVGIELLLKAMYLKNGYAINLFKTEFKDGLKFPFLVADVERANLDPSNTVTLARLIDSLGKVIPEMGLAENLAGLRIAKVFRNKEGHVVTGTHKFDPAHYKSIEAALVAMFRFAFDETLTVRIAFAHGESGRWKVIQ